MLFRNVLMEFEESFKYVSFVELKICMVRISKYKIIWQAKIMRKNKNIYIFLYEFVILIISCSQLVSKLRQSCIMFICKYLSRVIMRRLNNLIRQRTECVV